MKLSPAIRVRCSRMPHPRTPRSVVAKHKRPATILVPTDFSYAADRALHQAVPMARGLRARIALLHVVAPILVPDVFLASIRTDLPQLAALSEERLVRLARRQGIRPTQTAVKIGHAAEEILRYADEIGAGLIVIGSRGHGALQRMLIGSTAERVVRHAHCPVMVVPLPEVGSPEGSFQRGATAAERISSKSKLGR